MNNNYWIDEHTLAALDFDNSIDDLTGRVWNCSNTSNLRFIDDNPFSDKKNQFDLMVVITYIILGDY